VYEEKVIVIEEIPVEEADRFFWFHLSYLVEDGIVTDVEDAQYFASNEYRDTIMDHMRREKDKHHLVWFKEDGNITGAASYCTYQSEDGKCFILDFWVFPDCRGNGMGHRCFEALEQYTRADGAKYYELNSEKEDSVRFWKSLGFTENGEDEYGMPLFVKR
jgi:GNAT superfamily N-acetyltransferase